jgi:16S rRNA (adenine1518-N6/adenine1519-N6)-dimethyltransferase
VNNAKRQLQSQGLVARKSLGQNFLVDEAIARKVVAAANVQPSDLVIEIGPGTGALTKHLVGAASLGHVIAIELDANLIPILQANLSSFSNLTVIQADALEVDFAALVGQSTQQDIRVVANIPYYITSALIRRLLESGLTIASIVLTIQKEVAERIVAKPNDMSLLAVSVQFYGTPDYVDTVPPSAFYPQPKVHSAVLRITPHGQWRGLGLQAGVFFDVVRAGFSQPRKQLRNNLTVALGLDKAQAEALLTACHIHPSRRAETLHVADWVALANQWAASRSPKP